MMSDILRELGIAVDAERVHLDWCPAKLVAWALAHGEGVLTATGALAVNTGTYTGRAPPRRYIVDEGGAHQNVNWASPQNRPVDAQTYRALRTSMTRYLSGRDLFVVRAFAGADRAYARRVLVVCERASQALFIRQLLVRPTKDELECFGRPDIVVLATPDYHPSEHSDGIDGDSAVILNFNERVVLVAGTGYSGEIKKGVFTTMSYLLPLEDGVLPMHCSSNVDPVTGKTAILFGLSGTGKTTLSADPGRRLIGDDEHGWSPSGIFNIEGGCYAKCLGLTREREPEIYDAVRFGAVAENLVLDPQTHEPDYAGARITQNTRVGYPISHIASALEPSVGQTPSVVLFLTADAYGVLPPISRLDRTQAMFHFLTGYTSKVAGTEVGVTEPEPTFSALFGEPFMPLDHMVYAYLLGEKIARNDTKVYLVNTGWTGGPFGVGHRIALSHTRALVRAAMDDSLDDAGWRHDDTFDVDVPRACLGVPPDLLDPRRTWEDKDAYDQAAKKLSELFAQNFEKRYPGVSPAELATIKR